MTCVADAMVGIARRRCPNRRARCRGRQAARTQRVEILRDSARRLQIAGPVDLAGIEVADERAAQFVLVARSGDQERRLRPGVRA